MTLCILWCEWSCRCSVLVVLWDTVGWGAELPCHVFATAVLRCVWAGCFCMMMSNSPTSVWNELLVLSSRRHHRWKHSAIILLESHLTQHIRQIPCFVGHGSFPRSTRLVRSVWHRMAALHRLEKLTAKRLLNPGCSCCFGFSWGVQLVRRVRQSFFPITRRWFEPN